LRLEKKYENQKIRHRWKAKGKSEKTIASCPARFEKSKGQNGTVGMPREEETKKLLSAAKRKLPELKALLASVSDHWHYEDPIYRFYHHSFKVLRAQTTTLKIVETLQACAASQTES
jgi:hypothetical protein